MTLYNWLALFGIGSIISGALVAVFKIAFAHIKAVKLGVQALLRAQMIQDYNKWMERGYAPIYARETFENSWRQYHSLGANGVMDDIHTRFLSLPTEPPVEKEESK